MTEEKCEGNCEGCCESQAQQQVSQRDVLVQELTMRVQICQAKAVCFQKLLEELPPTLSDDAMSALLHLLMKTRKDV